MCVEGVRWGEERKGRHEGVERAERCWEIGSSVMAREVRRKRARPSGVKQKLGERGGWSVGGEGGGAAMGDEGGAGLLDQNVASLGVGDEEEVSSRFLRMC